MIGLTELMKKELILNKFLYRIAQLPEHNHIDYLNYNNVIFELKALDDNFNHLLDVTYLTYRIKQQFIAQKLMLTDNELLFLFHSNFEHTDKYNIGLCQRLFKLITDGLPNNFKKYYDLKDNSYPDFNFVDIKTIREYCLMCLNKKDLKRIEQKPVSSGLYFQTNKWLYNDY